MSALLRPVVIDDAPAFVQLRRLITPYQVVTVAVVRHRWTSSPEGAHLLVLVAEVDGEVVGIGRAELNTWTSEEGAGSLVVQVHPDHRQRGIGDQIHNVLEAHLRGHGAKRVSGWAVDQPETQRWCEARGYERTHEIRMSRLDLRDLDALPPIPELPEDVTVASFAEIGPEPVYAIDSLTIVDEPGDVVSDSISYEAWSTEVWQNPANDFDASTVVLVDGQPVAYTLVEADLEGRRMWSGATGTLREHRGRGLGRIAKSIAVRRAARTGIVDAYTSNDEVNRPMLAINEWLGYKHCATQWSFIKTL